MRHVEKALNTMIATSDNSDATAWIELENCADEKGVAPKVKFTIQSDPIMEVGVNGCQATDMLEYVKCLFESLNSSFPCKENAATITALYGALEWQEQRTINRKSRGVEGKNEA